MSEKTRLATLKELGWGYEEIAELLEELKAELNGKRIPRSEKVSNAQIIQLLNHIGVSYTNKGRRYIIETIQYRIKHPNASFTQEIYPAVGEKFQTKGTRVERCIRHEIERCFDIPGNDLLVEIFGLSISLKEGKVPNSEFIDGLVSYLTNPKVE